MMMRSVKAAFICAIVWPVAHFLAAHPGAALVGFGHLVAHAPQCSGSVARLVSQPSLSLPLQSSKPLWHSEPHVPAVQVPAELAGGMHGIPQAPQFCGSL